MERDIRWTDLLWDTVTEYFENTTLHGYRYLTEPGRHWVERAVWLVVHVVAIWGVMVIIVDLWREFLDTPTVTTIDSTNFPIWNVPFPAVAVCNLNKISRAAALQMADQLSASQNVSADALFKMLRYLGRLYDHDLQDNNDFEYLHELLARDDENYNVTDLMLRLSPNCSQLMVRCMWMGHVQDCSKLFSPRKTMEGYCCAFNYIRNHDNFVSGSESEEDPQLKRYKGWRVSSPGHHMGLSVIVNPEPDDYYYPLISSIGTKLLVFNPLDYPDTPSGGLIEKLVPLRSEVFFRLDATTVYSTMGVKSFSIAQRNCLFKSELSNLFAGYYSYSECLMNCRIRSITALCQCVPFYFPSRGVTRECTLTDIGCLSQYREKWSTLRPTKYIKGLEMERQVSISCEECLPACSDTTYNMQTTSAPLTDQQYQRSPLVEGLTLENHSVFHLFFGSVNSLRLKQDVLYYWYELLSNFGGICGLFVGFSLISIVEFVYFFTLRLFFVCSRHSTSLTHPVGVRRRSQTDIYWLEILPYNNNNQRY